MSSSILPRITPRDFALLESMIENHNPPAGENLVAAIRKKLAAVRIVFAGDMADNVVTIGSRVAVMVNAGPLQERRLVLSNRYVPGQQHQSIASLRGIALLGLAAGDCTEIDHGTHTEELKVHSVLYQPEAATRSYGPHPVRDPSFIERPIGAPYLAVCVDNDPGPCAA